MIIYLLLGVAAAATGAGAYVFHRRRSAQPPASPEPLEPSEPQASETIESISPAQGAPPLLHAELSTLPEADKQILMNAIWYHCENPYCNHSKFLEVHHITSEIEGGNSLSNLIVLCSVCHTAAHNNELSVEQLKSWIQDRTERLRYNLDWPYK